MSMAERFDENEDELLREFQPAQDNKEEKLIMTHKQLAQLFTTMLLDLTNENPGFAAAIYSSMKQREEENSTSGWGCSSPHPKTTRSNKMEKYEDMPVFDEPDFLNSEPPAAATATAKAAVQVAAPTLQEVQRPLPGGAHQSSFINDLEQQYMLLVGHSMSDDARKILYGLMQFNNIKSNDAALSMMIVQLYTAEKLGMMPYNIDLIQSKAVRDTVKNGEKIIQDETQKAALKFTEKVNAMIEERASGGKKSWADLPWTAAVILFAGFFFGNCFPQMLPVKFLLAHLFSF